MTEVLPIKPECDVSAETPARRRKRVIGIGVAICGLVGCLGTSSFEGAEPAAKASLPMIRAMHSQIQAMSTGADQALVNIGDSAVERNARIPLSASPLVRMRGFSEISSSAPGYSNALKCLSQAIYYEAANEPESGKRAVAQVVINRVRHPAYPDSVCGVVYEGANAPVCQFSFTCDGSLLRPAMARQWAESQRIAKEALAGSVSTEVGSATNYHADYVLPRWAFTLGKLTQIGRHIFYRLPGRLGGEAMFADRWTGIERIPALDFDRLRRRLAARSLEEDGPAPEEFVPGLTVVSDVKDRHAANDVGGRLDMTTAWRLTIPDPNRLNSQYRSSLENQGEVGAAVASSDSDREAVLDPS